MDYIADVKKYTANVDEAAVAAMEATYRLALSQDESKLVAYSDGDELERVKTNFLKGKLGLTDADDLDGAIAAVGEKMAGVSHKSRLTVYYLLAEHVGKLDALK